MIRRRKKIPTPLYSRLEKRRVLAGNVTVILHDEVLTVFGDGEANQVELTGTATGTIQVTGVDTTINGGDADFVTSGVGFVTVALAGGNDTASVDNVNLTGNLSFAGEAGDDRFEVSNSGSRYLHLNGGAGNDVFEVGHAARKSAYIYLGDGNDVVSVVDLFTRRNFKVFGGNGDDTFASSSMKIGRKFELHLENGNDEVLISGTADIGRRAKIYGGPGDEFVSIAADSNSTSVHFDRAFMVNLEEGNDTIAVGASATFDARPRLDGSVGTNSIQIDSGIRSTVKRFENESIPNLQTLIDGVIATLDAVGVNNTQPVQTQGLSLTVAAFAFEENGAAVAFDPGLTLTGSGQASSATVTIAGFTEGNESLSFTDTSEITGNFDTTPGVLTLTGAASTAAYQAALRSVTYQNTNENPSDATRQFDVSVIADEETLTGSRELQLTSVNDAPAITLVVTDRTLDATGLPALIDNQLTVADVDNTQLESAQVSITSGFNTGEDVLGFTETAGITGAFDAAAGTLTLTGDSGNGIDIADLQTVLRTVQLENTADTPTAGGRTIEVAVNDGTVTDSFGLTITIQDVAAS